MRKHFTREGEYAVIRIPMTKLHNLVVALEECPCKAAKSNSTAVVRKWVKDGLQGLEAGK
jgi:hypothetical protein